MSIPANPGGSFSRPPSGANLRASLTIRTPNSRAAASFGRTLRSNSGLSSQSRNGSLMTEILHSPLSCGMTPSLLNTTSMTFSGR